MTTRMSPHDAEASETVRVSQLARVLGIPSTELLVRLSAADDSIRSVNALVPARLAAPLLQDAVPRRHLAELRDLLRAAFENARRSGREDWRVMTTAVLKNRLLDVSNRQFDETDYGAPNMVSLVTRLSDILDLDTNQRPPRTTLRDPGALGMGSGEPSPTRLEHEPIQRVRADLWRAVIDYRSGRTYVWDPYLRLARRSVEGDHEIVMPTVRHEESRQWRSEFAGAQSPETREDQDRLDEWMQREYATAYLPSNLQGPWNGFLRSKVVARLTDFFTTNGLDTPPDLLGEASRVEAHQPVQHTETNRMRELVHRCVDVMSQSELEGLRLEIGIIRRALRSERN